MPQNDSCKKVNETVTEHEEIKTAALVGGLGRPSSPHNYQNQRKFRMYICKSSH